jgi:AGCS family alanine or glycine:cation symporter
MVILGLHADQLGNAFTLMFKSAFGISSAVGGVLGFAVIKSITTGFDRAIFATDAGTGTVPLLQSGAKTTNPVIDGMVSLVAPVIVMIVCTTTALVLLVTGAFGTEGLQSTDMVTYAFTSGLSSKAGLYVVMVSLVLFGYTTTIAWASCLQRAVVYLFGTKYVRAFHWLYIIMVPVGALMHVHIAWILADIFLTAMLVINLIGVAGLSKEVVRDTEKYFLKNGCGVPSCTQD